MKQLYQFRLGTELQFFFTESDTFRGASLKKTLITLLSQHGIEHYSVRLNKEGMDKHHHLHSWQLFETADRPSELITLTSEEKADALVAHLSHIQFPVFCTAKPARYARLDET